MSEPQKLPAGRDEAQVRDLIVHYNGQSEGDQATEIEAALAGDAVTMVAVPVGLVVEVRATIARKQSA